MHSFIYEPNTYWWRSLSYHACILSCLVQRTNIHIYPINTFESTASDCSLDEGVQEASPVQLSLTGLLACVSEESCSGVVFLLVFSMSAVSERAVLE